MLKKKYFLIILALLMTVTATAYAVYGDYGDISRACKFVESYGWEIERMPADTSDVTVPAEFDEVYKNYNKLQLKSQLDLTPYRGMSGKRYTFVVTNYPVDVGETVYANVIVINSKPVAGDIMTVSLSGFMHGLGESGP